MLKRTHLLALAAMPLLVLGGGCFERDTAGLDQARAPIDPLIFGDDYGTDVYFQPFAGTYEEAVSLDETTAQNEGGQSLKVTVPVSGSSLGQNAAGVLTSSGVRDHTDFNALTFYARAGESTTLDLAGFGNDNTGTSRFEASRSNIPLSTDWVHVVVPIPDASRLIAERGQFVLWEGSDAPGDREIWLDEIRFAQLDNITNPRPEMKAGDLQFFVGSQAGLLDVRTLYDVDGATVAVGHSLGYFDFEFATPGVAVADQGVIRMVGTGSTDVTATLKGEEVVVRYDYATQDATVTLIGYEPPAAPAPAPTLPSNRVISLFSGAYDDVPVDSFNPEWLYSTTALGEYSVGGDTMLMYGSFNFVGITFDSNPIDASEMSHLHLDVYAPVGTDFSVEVITNGGSSALSFDADSTPAFVAGDWSSLDIPLEDFDLPGAWDEVRQLVLSSDDVQIVLVDNIYWHD